MSSKENITYGEKKSLSPILLRRFNQNELETTLFDAFVLALEITKKGNVSEPFFTRQLIRTTCNVMIDHLHYRIVSTYSDIFGWYDEVHQSLVNFYENKIIKWYDTYKHLETPTNKSITNENLDKGVAWILRRLNSKQIIELIEGRVSVSLSFASYPCLTTKEEFVDSIVWHSINFTWSGEHFLTRFDEFKDYQDFSVINKILFDFIKEKQSERIIKFYEIKCNQIE